MDEFLGAPQRKGDDVAARILRAEHHAVQDHVRAMLGLPAIRFHDFQFNRGAVSLFGHSLAESLPVVAFNFMNHGISFVGFPLGVRWWLREECAGD